MTPDGLTPEPQSGYKATWGKAGVAGAEAQETGGLQGQTTAWSSPPQALCSGGLQALERDAAPGHPLPPEVGKPILVISQRTHKVNIPC